MCTGTFLHKCPDIHQLTFWETKLTEFKNPSSIAPPVGAYSHSVKVTGAGQWLYIAGQIGVDAQGTLAEGAEGQADAAWRNLLAILGDAGMGAEHLVKITTYLIDSQDLPAANAVRKRYLGECRPAATLVVAKELARPEWLFEVEAVAFKEG